MKKLFFFVLLLPLWGLGGFSIAHASVTVTPLSTDFTAQKVTFRVEYANAANNRAWIWIDLCPVSGAVAGTFSKAEISAVIANSGSWDNTSLNTRGFYVTHSPSTITATLNNAAGKFKWCAYGSDFPPNAVENGSSYTLKGSPPFILTTASGTVSVNEKTYSGNAVTALTDATGCPGVLCNKNGETAGLLGCCNGASNCSGTCTTTGNYTTNDGACTGSCNMAYVQLRNECGVVTNSQYSTYTQPSCTGGCEATYKASCYVSHNTSHETGSSQSMCDVSCRGYCTRYGYRYYHNLWYSAGCYCGCCN